MKEDSANFKQPHRSYDRATSTSFTLLSDDHYDAADIATGNIRGTEHVSFGGREAQNQTIFVASAMPRVELGGVDGILGLSAPMPADRGRVRELDWPRTLLENLAPQLELPVLAVSLHSFDRGTFVFGNFDLAAFKGRLATAPSGVQNTFWTTGIPRFQVGSGPVEATAPGRRAIVDTGTNTLPLHEEIATRYWSQVPQSERDGPGGSWRFPCGTTLPDLRLEVAPGYLALIPGKLLSAVDASGKCYGLLQGRGSDPQAILGVPFFHAQYTVFNIRDRTLSFAERVEI